MEMSNWSKRYSRIGPYWTGLWYEWTNQGYIIYDKSQKSIQRRNLIELYANNNPKIKDVSFMTNLKKLYADKDCGIDQKGIQGLDLIELYCTINEKIKDVSFMRNLKILYVDNCGIDQQGIRGLDLIELHCRRNEKIKDISFMKNLTSWSTSYSCVY